MEIRICMYIVPATCTNKDLESRYVKLVYTFKKFKNLLLFLKSVETFVFDYFLIIFFFMADYVIQSEFICEISPAPPRDAYRHGEKKICGAL